MATALTETMIINNFFLKVTQNAQETVDYLASLTRCLENLKSDVMVVPPEALSLENHHDLRKGLAARGTPVLIPLDSFNALNTKTKTLNHLDIWQKQLLTIRGVSIEKAALISKKISSFHQFMEWIDQKGQAGCVQELIAMGIGNASAKKIVALFVE